MAPLSKIAFNVSVSTEYWSGGDSSTGVFEAAAVAFTTTVLVGSVSSINVSTMGSPMPSEMGLIIRVVESVVNVASPPNPPTGKEPRLPGDTDIVSQRRRPHFSRVMSYRLNTISRDECFEAYHEAYGPMVSPSTDQMPHLKNDEDHSREHYTNEETNWVTQV